MLDPSTIAAQAGGGHRPDPGAVVPPLEPSTTFRRDRDYHLLGDHTYARDGAPTVEAVEATVTALDGGEDALAFASGMAAIAAVVGTLQPGARLVAPRIMYHGAQDLFRRAAGRGDVDLVLFDAADPGALEAALAEGAALLWLESPVNPTWDVIDLAAAARAGHAAGAIVAVDSTVAPPPTTRPLELGADLVVHSATKYLNGHSDLTAGVVVTARRDDRWRELRRLRKVTGGVLGPFEAWLLLRGLQTLFVRFQRASTTALRIARRFADDPRLEAVLYPGLPSHPGHEIARRQMTGGFGGMLSILVRGDADAARRVAAATDVFVPATSLGGVESLIEHRATVEGPHSAVPPNLVRLSIGLEAPEDLIADLDRALGRPHGR